jgi:hypothetical protein
MTAKRKLRFVLLKLDMADPVTCRYDVGVMRTKPSLVRTWKCDQISRATLPPSLCHLMETFSMPTVQSARLCKPSSAHLLASSKDVLENSH